MNTDLGALSDLTPTSKDAKALIPALIELFTQFEMKIEQNFKDMKTEFLNTLREKDSKINELRNENHSLKKRVSNLEDRIESNDQYERRDTLILSGEVIPPYSTGENSNAVVRKLFHENLNLEISDQDISVSHRLGAKSPSQRPDKRNLIVKFCRRNSKIDVLAAARRVKARNFYVAEHLTPMSQTIAYVLRKAKRSHPNKISGSNTIDGKNYVWVKPPNADARGAHDTRMPITSHEKLKDFCEKVLQCPLEDYISEWIH